MRCSIRIVLLGVVALVVIATTGVVLANTISVQKEVRVVARLLENGKVEFGVQERTGGGEWGETLLPRVNKLNIESLRQNDQINQWRYSSPVELTPAEFETAEDDLRPDPVTGDIAHWRFLGGETSEGELFGYLLLSEGTETGGALVLACPPWGGTDVRVGTDEYLLNDRGTDQITVWYRVEGGELQSARWESNETFDSILAASEPESFLRWLASSVTQSTTFYFSVTDRYGDSYHGTFDVTGIHAVLEALPCFSVKR